MKRLVLILLALPLVSAAEVVVPVDAVENHVNIRLSPDAGAEIVGHLNRGEWLKFVASTPGWHEVEIPGGATGFISADWTRVLDEPPAAMVPEETPAEDTAGPASTDAGTNVANESAAAGAGEHTDDEPLAIGDEATPDTQAESEQPGNAQDVTAGAAQVIEAVDEPVAGDVDATTDTESRKEEESGSEPAVVDSETAPPAEAIDEAGADTAVNAAAEEPASATVASGADTKPAAVAADLMQTAVVATVVPGPQGPPGPAGPPGQANVAGSVDFLMKFTAPTSGGNSQVYDDGNNVGIGTTKPQQRLEVNGNIQIHEQNSSVAGLMITQSDGETGYIMHNRASTLTIGAGSVDRITIDRNGNVGLGVSRPSSPLELANGAHVTAGGVWTNSSSRARKENITDLPLDAAAAALAQLQPVEFNYKNDRSESYVGFIAEDVPELVATNDRDGLSAMDIVAVLTRVVQDQQRRIEELEARLEQR